MSRRKTAAELEEEYKRAEQRVQKLREQMKRASAAEEAKKKSELIQLVLEWAESYEPVGTIDGAIAWFQKQIERNREKKK